MTSNIAISTTFPGTSAFQMARTIDRPVTAMMPSVSTSSHSPVWVATISLMYVQSASERKLTNESTRLALRSSLDESSGVLGNINATNIAKLRSFLALSQNWNGYDAVPFTPQYLTKAEQLLQLIPWRAEVFPIPDGRVQFEFDRTDGAYLEIEVNDDASLSVFSVMPDNSEQEYDAPDSEITEIVRRFYEG